MESLKGPRKTAAYLDAAIKKKERAIFLLALRNVAKAHGGITSIGVKAGVKRESLYHVLKKRYPQIESVPSFLFYLNARPFVPSVFCSKHLRWQNAHFISFEFIPIIPIKHKCTPLHVPEKLPSVPCIGATCAFRRRVRGESIIRKFKGRTSYSDDLGRSGGS